MRRIVGLVACLLMFVAVAQESPAPTSDPTPQLEAIDATGSAANESPTIAAESESNQLQKFGLICAAVAFIAIFAAGASNRLVIYVDKNDFIWSMSTAVIPIVAHLAALYLAPANAGPDYNIYLGDAYGIAITVVAVAAELVALYKLVNYALMANGPAWGTVVAVFKLTASLVTVFLVIFVLFDALSKDKNKQPSAGNAVAMVAIMAAIGWVMSKLINGPAVEARRQALGQRPAGS